MCQPKCPLARDLPLLMRSEPAGTEEDWVNAACLDTSGMSVLTLSCPQLDRPIPCHHTGESRGGSTLRQAIARFRLHFTKEATEGATPARFPSTHPAWHDKRLASGADLHLVGEPSVHYAAGRVHGEASAATAQVRSGLNTLTAFSCSLAHTRRGHSAQVQPRRQYSGRSLCLRLDCSLPRRSTSLSTGMLRSKPAAPRKSLCREFCRKRLPYR